MPLPGPLVDGDWLAAHLADVSVIDVRWYADGRSGHAAYLDGHIPGAVWIDLDAELSAPPSRTLGRHPLPDADRFAAALGRCGIADGHAVVCCDDAGGSVAARLWWLLHVLGEPVAVLDGGLDAWPGARSTEVPEPVPVARTARPWPAERFADADAVASEIARGGRAVFDARAADRFAGAASGLDPRPGHIPGARSAPWAQNLGSDGRFRPASELQERFAPARAGAIAYCGSGVTACHDLLAMTLAGYRDLALYPGSWSQWGADPARPAATG